MITSNFNDKIKDFVSLQKEKQQRLKQQTLTILKFIENNEKAIKPKQNKH